MRLALSALLFLAACATSPSTPPRPAAQASLSFAWPEDLALRVRYERHRERDGEVVERGVATYLQRSLAQPAGERRLVVEGVEVSEDSSPTMKQMASLPMPTLVIDASGEPLRVEDVQKTVDLLVAQTGATGDKEQALRTLLGSSISAGVLDEWRSWIGNWRSKTLREGEPISESLSAPLPGGIETIRLELTSSLVGRSPCPVASARECVTLHFISRPAAEDLPKVVEGLLSQAFAAAGLTGEQRPKIADAEVRSEVTLVAEPSSLIPHALERTRRTRIRFTLADGRELESAQLDTNRYTYETVASGATP